MKLRYDALLFDFDGVLADTEPLHYQAWKQTLAGAGIDVTWEFYLANCVGVADDALFPKVFPIADSGRLVEAKRTAYRAAIEAAPPFLEPTLQLLRGSSQEYPMAVVSSSARVEVEPPLIRAGVAGCFRLIVTREDVVNIKPSPEPYLKAARLLGALRPLVIEDSPSGIAAGRASNFDVLEICDPASMPESVRVTLERPIRR